MIALTINNQVHPTWNDSVKMHVNAGLAFLPVDFARVTVAMELVPGRSHGTWEYRCSMNAEETGGNCHEISALDADPHQALEHVIHLVVRAVMGKGQQKPGWHQQVRNPDMEGQASGP